MIAVDTNILVYAHREDSPFYSRARSVIQALADSPAPWCIPWPSIHEFFSIVTHPKIYDPPTPNEVALETVRRLVNHGGAQLLSESENHWEIMDKLVTASGITGPKIHDARIAAICLGHGITQLYTADRDFSYFPQLRTHNPLVAAG